MQRTLGTLFGGFGGVDIGAMAAGFVPLWSIEYDAAIADVARGNLGDHVITADILDIDPVTLAHPIVLHASPPCPNFSNAKANGEESDNDRALAAKVAEFVEVMRPEYFTLENVYAYRKSESWATIRATLHRLSYAWDYWHLNSADMGVPQTRKRMIVVARRDGHRPQRPTATHAEPEKIAPMFDDRRPWVGWYEAIADLVPGLPDSELAPWQKERLPDEIAKGLELPALLSQGISRDANNVPYDGLLNRRQHEPALTITSNSNMGTIRAILVDYGNTSRGATVLAADAPAVSVQAWHGRRPSQAPSAILPHRVVEMTARCGARWQSFPNDYALPDKAALAWRGLGNAVPPLLYRRIAETLT